jgi:formylglycine-generating enzyme required for sulfatase activity
LYFIDINNLITKAKHIIFLLALILFSLSCEENSIITESGPSSIDYLSKNETFIGDTITIYGVNFGNPSINTFVVFDDTTIVPSSQCLLWTISKITLIIPNTLNDSLYVITETDTTKPIQIVINKIAPFETVKIDGGEFLMGSKDGFKDEQPEHYVIITHSLIVGKYEVSQLLYKQVMGVNPSTIKGDNLPVDSVEWSAALEFCNRLSEIQGLTACYKFTGNNATWDITANGWRLPTEAEWEYLCRAGSTTDYSGSYAIENLGWYNMNSGLQLHPFGQKQGNAFALFDMHGNVWEWCWDWYGSEYYTSSDKINPQGSAAGERRVARGGSFIDGNSYLRSSNRSYLEENLPYTGFRICREDK